MNLLTVLNGDALDQLKKVETESVQCCVTSPPYFGLRDYGNTGQIGLEKTPDEYVAKMVAVSREVRRVLKNDGTLWLNLGDSYAGSGKGGNPEAGKQATNHGSQSIGVLYGKTGDTAREAAVTNVSRLTFPEIGIKAKDLVGIPWMVAFALRADGWWLRQDIIWSKANCIPESVTDRCTKSHEYLFMLTKQAKYYYDAEAIKEPCIYDVDGTGTAARKARAEGNKLLPTEKVNGLRPGGYKNSVNFEGKNSGREKQRGHSRKPAGFNDRWDAMEKVEQCTGMRNKRDVWTIAPANFPDAHFATYPPDLIKPCILAGSKPGDVILDPFAGSGTTGMVALELGRKALLIELNPEYVKLLEKRCAVTPGFQFQ